MALTLLIFIAIIGVGAQAQTFDYTSTLISCVPNQVLVEETTSCTASVTNISGSSSPSGTVHFNRMGKGSGYFGTGSLAKTCQLIAFGPGRAECNVAYTPTQASEIPSEPGAHIIIGTFEGTPEHSASASTAEIKINLRSSILQLFCESEAVVIGEQTNCTVEVSTIQPSESPFITGIVAFMYGGFSGINQCSLVIDLTTSKCSITLTATAPAATGILQALFLGNENYMQSEDLLVIAKETRHSITEIQCESIQLKLGEPAICSIRVNDMSDGLSSQPHGIARISRAQNAESSNSVSYECVLESLSDGSSSCSINFIPTEIGPQDYRAQFIDGLEIHGQSDTSITLIVEEDTFSERNRTRTQVECSSKSIQIGHTTTCEARVSLDGAKSRGIPLGEVAFGSDFTSDRFSEDSCRLQPIRGGARCQISFTAMESVGTRMITAGYIGSSELQPSSTEFSLDIVGIPVRFSIDFGESDQNGTPLLDANSTLPLVVTLLDLDENELPDGTKLHFSISQGFFENGDKFTTSVLKAGSAQVLFNTADASGSTNLIILLEDSIYVGRYAMTFIVQGECTGDDCPSEIDPGLFAISLLPFSLGIARRFSIKS
jgi:hypothetical protein